MNNNYTIKRYYTKLNIKMYVSVNTDIIFDLIIKKNTLLLADKTENHRILTSVFAD